VEDIYKGVGIAVPTASAEVDDGIDEDIREEF
jgi:hypothetical protein